MRRKKRICSFMISFYVLVSIYSCRLFGVSEDFYDFVSVWFGGFKRIDVYCIHWLLVRIPVWILVLERAMQLEHKFALYLFIRKRNSKYLIGKQWLQCGTIITIYYFLWLLLLIMIYMQKYGIGALHPGWGILNIVICEMLSNALFCLLVYGLYCKTRLFELSFCIILLLTCAVKIFLPFLKMNCLEMIVICFVLVLLVLDKASKGFYERVIES